MPTLACSGRLLKSNGSSFGSLLVLMITVYFRRSLLFRIDQKLIFVFSVECEDCSLKVTWVFSSSWKMRKGSQHFLFANRRNGLVLSV